MRAAFSNGSLSKTDKFCYGIVAILLTCDIVLGILHVTFNWGEVDQLKLAKLFHLGKESNAPTWFSSSQFLLLGLICGLIFALKRYLYPDNRANYLWALCALGSVFLSLDETALVHETVGTAFQGFVNSHEVPLVGGFLKEFHSFYWALIYVPIALPVAAVIGIFYWKEMDRYRYFPIAGIVIFLLGAVGVDFVQGIYYGMDDEEITGSARWLMVDLDSYLIEEMFEMLGVTLVLTGCLLKAASLVPAAKERFRKTKSDLATA